ncbi:hypothetical protein ACOMHN_008629 [Nucella lapillus]
MKLALVLLVLLPFAMSAPMDKRGILDFLGLSHLLDIQELKQTVQQILDTVGSDASEQACESTCHNLLFVDQSNVIHTLCNPICRSFQTLVNILHLTPSSN